MDKLLQEIRNIGLMPVIKLNDPKKGVELCKALIKGGIPVAEVTFRAAGADKAIAAISKELPEMYVGAGTVINIKQAELAINAGAKYIVSPGFVPEVINYCISKNVPVIPGCSNASEVSVASNMGLEVVKFFPAEALGGLKVLKALAGPFSAMKFIPTGGIGPHNLKDYMKFSKVITCGGSWMVPPEMVDNNDWNGITALAKEAMATLLDVSLVHIGINAQNKQEALSAAKTFAMLLNKDIKEAEIYTFAGSEIELMHSAGRGKNGHIALGVSDVGRAIRYYSSLGIEFDQSSIKYNGETPTFAYLKNEICGFAIHIENK